MPRIPKWAQICPEIEKKFRDLQRQGIGHAEIHRILVDDIAEVKRKAAHKMRPTYPRPLVEPWRCECGHLIQYKDCLLCKIPRRKR